MNSMFTGIDLMITKLRKREKNIQKVDFHEILDFSTFSGLQNCLVSFSNLSRRGKKLEGSWGGVQQPFPNVKKPKLF